MDKTCHMIPSYISTVGKQQIIDGTIAAETSFFIIFLISNTKSLGAQQIKTLICGLLMTVYGNLLGYSSP